LEFGTIKRAFIRFFEQAGRCPKITMMKIMSVFLIYAVILQVSTCNIGGCNPTYTCQQKCIQYKNDSIKICRSSYPDSVHFQQATDSLGHVYGTGIPFISDSVSVTGSSNNAVNSIVSQFEKQGYTCY
jgi:hypothetical protein